MKSISLYSRRGTKSYFFPKGEPLAQGDVLTNREYANLMRQLADRGTDIFYSGPIADAIVNTVSNRDGNAGLLNLDDFANYTIKERPQFVQNSEHTIFVGWDLHHQEQLEWVKFWE